MSVPGPRRTDSPGIRSALQGRLAEISLFDVCQFLMLNRKTGILTARHQGLAVYLTFKDGQLLNAVDHALKDGESVILAAVQWPDGAFVFEAGPVPPERRIQSSTENILLEAARQLDEMRAGDLLETEEGEERPATPSHVDRFHELQQRSAELSEAFREAVAVPQGETNLGPSWKESLEDVLTSGRGERLVVGPGEAIHLVHATGAVTVEVPSFAEVEEWLGSIAVSPPEWDAYEGPTVSRWGCGPNGARVWVSRHSGPEGRWYTVVCPSSRFPDWRGMGFGEGVAVSRSHLDHGPVILAAPSARLVAQSVAAYLGHRSHDSPELVWVVEPQPSFDWHALPGRIRSLDPTRVARPGAMSLLCDASRPSLLVVRDCAHPGLVDDCLALHAPDLHVLVAMKARDPESVLAPWQGDPLGAEIGVSGDARRLAPSGLWWVQPGSGQPYPVRSRFHRVGETRTRAA